MLESGALVGGGRAHPFGVTRWSFGIDTILRWTSAHDRPDRRSMTRRTAGSFLERRFARVLHEPPSVRLATLVIVSATALVVAGSGVLMWLLDHDEYPNVGVAMWWAAQTVTTVG